MARSLASIKAYFEGWDSQAEQERKDAEAEQKRLKAEQEAAAAALSLQEAQAMFEEYKANAPVRELTRNANIQKGQTSVREATDENSPETITYKKTIEGGERAVKGRAAKVAAKIVDLRPLEKDVDFAIGVADSDRAAAEFKIEVDNKTRQLQRDHPFLGNPAIAKLTADAFTNAPNNQAAADVLIKSGINITLQPDGRFKFGSNPTSMDRNYVGHVLMNLSGGALAAQTGEIKSIQGVAQHSQNMALGDAKIAGVNAETAKDHATAAATTAKATGTTGATTASAPVVIPSLTPTAAPTAPAASGGVVSTPSVKDRIMAGAPTVTRQVASNPTVSTTAKAIQAVNAVAAQPVSTKSPEDVALDAAESEVSLLQAQVQDASSLKNRKNLQPGDLERMNGELASKKARLDGLRKDSEKRIAMNEIQRMRDQYETAKTDAAKAMASLQSMKARGVSVTSPEYSVANREYLRLTELARQLQLRGAK